MLQFQCDYEEGCLPEILQLLAETNLIQTVGYGEDEYCARARQLIKEECQAPDADVHFLVGGTHTNKAVIRSILRSYEGVLSAATGHIATHETGTIEAGGHKVLTLPTANGKITPEQIIKAVEDHGGYNYHMVKPGMVYISNPTEAGTMYSKAELEAIRAAGDETGLPLFLDGARMGYGLFARGNDLTLADYARLCDVFYIGATKVGALFGEAVVINNDKYKANFKYCIKQNGALLAKGRLLGLQFIGLFDERKLYYKVGQHAMKLAVKLQDCFEELGFKDYYGSTSNQLFPVMPDELLAKLDENYMYSYETRVDDTHSAVRFCTSWATTEENVNKLIADLKALCR